MADNRTEKATPRRRLKAREQGQVLRSRELVSALTLVGLVFSLAWHPELGVARWHAYFRNAMDWACSGRFESPMPLITLTAGTILFWAGPFLAIAFVVAVAATLVQGAPTFAAEALSPNFARLNPVNNLQQLFSLAGLSRVLRSLVPTTVILYLALRLIQSQASAIVHAARLNARACLSLTGSLCFGLAWRTALVFLLWSGLDYFLQWQTFERSLRMTKQEVRDENKENEGNPQVRMRIRRLRRELLRQSLQQRMQKATAVVTNPTHYAVALEYRPLTMAAPVVVAKGQNLLAQRIKELARWNEIPIIENPPLAQALYKATEEGQMIPPKLYAAVAELLAFLYRAQRRVHAVAAQGD